ncbi:Mu-like prophage protein gp36 [Lutispora thermophila DSM 19022]|uniref:Mu-like prophage protein gp36 n=2 Tax=Lutispora TaxID=667112 RepID=A0A1M6ER25_9FIRM|nr:DUF1320 domain-containing protein [Lutispora thermophila]SHI87883.1 Mu-like prophage protein gp36 [Lutispora thermophila DSM 19022]
MAYCDIAEVRSMLKDDALNTIIGSDYIEDEAEREAKIIPIIEAAIADAGAEIDGYLAKRYTLPLSPVPQVIKKFAKDIAVYNLYSRIGIDENDREKNYLNRYKAAIRFFELLAEGKVEIGAVDTTTAARTGFSVASSPRLFSRDSLKGM